MAWSGNNLPAYDDRYGAFSGEMWTGKTKVLGEEPVWVSLYLPKFYIDGPGIEAGPPLQEAEN